MESRGCRQRLFWLASDNAFRWHQSWANGASHLWLLRSCVRSSSTMVGRMDSDASEVIGFSETALVMLTHSDIWLRFAAAFQPVATLASARDFYNPNPNRR